MLTSQLLRGALLLTAPALGCSAVASRLADPDLGFFADGDALARGLGAADAGNASVTEDAEIGAADSEVLSSRTIDAMVSAHSSSFRFCYEREREHAPDLAGRVIIEFEIGRDGTVSGERVAHSSLPSQRVEACLLRQVARLEFGSHDRSAPVTVEYPFSFRAVDS